MLSIMKGVVILLAIIISVGAQGQVPAITTTTTTTTTPMPRPLATRTKPRGSDWPRKFNDDRTVLADWLLRGCWARDPQVFCENSRESSNFIGYEGYDGWYNNVGRPDLGAIDRPLLRRWPAAYEDGAYAPSGSNRPNPLTLSEELLAGPPGSQSRTGKNALLVFFGQQVVEEILDAQRPACPPEYFNIPIPENHAYRKQPHHTEMPLLRTRYDQRTGYSPNNPRQQINEITPYIDGGLMYGITKQWADQLRTYQNGTVDLDGLLAYSEGGLFPEYNTRRLPLANPPPPFHHANFINQHEIDKVSRFFQLGNPRGNENTFLLTFGVLWFRWHNYLATSFRRHHKDWRSEKVFNEARKWVIGTYQHIVLDEWLPSWVNGTKMPPYKGYDPTIDPQIDQFFQAAAFRFGHTLVTPGVYLRDYGRKNCSTKFNNWGRNAVRTCNVFWRPQDAIKATDSENNFIDIDRVLMGMALQLCEAEDHKIVEDLRGNVFGPLEFPRRDLMAINIQRGRDHGLPDFNSARKAYGLPPITNVSHFKYPAPEIREKLLQLYNSLDDIDPWVGGILETGDGPGELFETVIIDQFRRIRDGDRYWFNNTENGLFTSAEIDRIKELTLYDVIMAVTKLDDDDIPRNPFRVVLDDTMIAQSCRVKLVTSECRRESSPSVFQSFTCSHLPQLNNITLNETCLQGDSYDYFSGSQVSFILTFIGVGTTMIGIIGGIFLLIHIKNKEALQVQMKINDQVRTSFKHDRHIDQVFAVKEWSGVKVPLRPVAVVLDPAIKQICIMSHKGVLLRALDLSYDKCSISIYLIMDEPYLMLKTAQEHDLILQFDSNYLRQNFHNSLEKFLDTIGAERENINNFNLKAGLKIAVTKEDRQKRLEMFFRVVFAQAFSIQHSKDEILKVDAEMAREVVYTELTLNEFAEALNMRPQAEFVVRMFSLIDKDKNGFVSFREFVDLLIIFAEGDETKKAQLLFDMYDINGLGTLTIPEFTDMIRSFLETVGGKVESSVLDDTITNMIRTAGLQNKAKLTFEDFKNIIGNDIQKLNKANLGFKGAPNLKQNRNSFLDDARNTIENIYESPSDIKARLQGTGGGSRHTSELIDKEQDTSVNANTQVRPGKYVTFFRYFEENAKEIFWMALYTLVLWAIFAERAYYYTVEREHSGLRRIAGYGVTVTRGAASAMMFTYSSLLVTMCRNTITFLRDTVVGTYFPFDSFVELHKYIAYWAIFFTIMHIIGHAFNFYHISTQTADDLTCLFRNYFHATHELPKFHYWCWQTMTGVTGIILTIITILIYLFAQPFVRRRLYNWFWYTHNLYPVFFIFMILHGSGRLIQEPFFHYFFLGPVTLFTLDVIVSVSRKKVEIPVLHAEVLPSNVTMLEFKRPENFEYKSGQWIRIACLGLNSNEYHPFTLTSSPNEPNLTVHIRSVGPWTRNIRTLYENAILSDQPLPKIHLDGAYGEGHQDWYRFDVSVLIGGGIGVTPFASILKDIVFQANTRHRAQCKKVYFIWVSRTQKQFEWLVDILRDLENSDENKIVSSHIFITQFYQKFDLRTILLYICELHYQKISNKSLFTNLEAVTHFGRPNFKKFFKSLQSLHQEARTVGVFSCGPPPMTSSVESACVNINRVTLDGPTFKHHFKNF